MGSEMCIRDSGGGDAGKAFYQYEVFGCPAETAARVVITSLDHQRISVPSSSRVACPLWDGGIEMRSAIEWDSANDVAHLLDDADLIGRLKDLEIAVVSGGHSRGREVEASVP